MALKITFDDPNEGWIGLSIRNGDDEVRIDGSYIYDSFLELVNALGAMLDVNGRRTVIWNEEPQETELCFENHAERIHLSIRRFPDHRRTSNAGTELTTIAGSYREVCLPFWRALRNLQSRFGPEALKVRWRREFPMVELERLTTAIEEAGVR